MKNLTFKAAMLNDSRTTVNRQSTDGQSQRHCKQTPLSKRWKVLMTLVFLFTMGIGQMWGTDYSSTPLVSLDFSSSLPTVSGVTYHAATYSSGKISWGGNYAHGTRDVQITFTTTGSKFKVVLGHIKSGSSMTFKYQLDDGSATNWTLGKTIESDEIEISASAGTHTIALGPGGSSTRTVVTSIAIYDEDTDGDATTYAIYYNCNGADSGCPDADEEATTLPNPLPDAPVKDGYTFDGWFTDDDTFEEPAVAGATLTDNVVLYAKWIEDVTPKYSVTYVLNGPSGDAPTQASVAAGTSITLAAAPSWAGHAFDGWLCNIDSDVKAAGSSYTMTAANTTFTAQWHEVDCKIYSFTGGIGSAEGTAGDYEITSSALILKNTNARIKLTPAGGETFKAGDIITISGYTGSATKKFGVYVKNAAGSSNIATAEVANLGECIASATLSADAEYVFLARKEGTTMNILTCEIHRSCAEGTAAGLSYATAEVNKTEGDAAFTNALTNTNGLVIAGYSSSNTAVATVNKAGQVTIVAPGSATITAHSAVQMKSGTLYAAGTASYALTVAALPEYSVTYDLNGGTGDVSEGDHKAGVIFTLHDGVTGITAPANKTFINWKDQDDALFDGGAEYTMPAKNVTLTAQWAGDVYTVKYMDGEDLLDTKVVEVGSHPADIEHPTKPLYTFAAWQLSGSDVVLDDVTGTKDATVILTARWAKVYASSYDMEAYAVSDGATLVTLLSNLDAAGYAYTNVYGIDNGHTHNYIYDGMKYKTNDGDLSFNVVAGKVVEVKTGYLPSNDAVTMYINSVADATVFEGADENIETHKTNYFYSAAEALYRLDVQASKGTCAVKAVTIRDPYTVSYNPHGADAIDAQNATPSVTLPTPVNGTGNFKGWYDAETEGNKIGNAGASYTPTANITLHAQWEVVSTDNTLSDLQVDGATVAGFDPEVQIYNLVYEYGQQPVITSATATAGALATVTINNTPVEEATFKYVQVKVEAESGAKRFYQVRYTNKPKQGATIFKAELTSNTAADYSGMYADGDNSEIKLADDGANGYKFSGTSNYVKMAIADATFAEGDMLKMTYTTNPQQGELAIYDGTTKLQGTAYSNHILTFSDAADGKSILFIRRTSDNNFNGWVAEVEVQRYMDPFIESFKIGEAVGTINESAKTIAIELPNGTSLSGVAATVEAYANGGATVTAPAALAYNTALSYTVSSAYAEDGDVTYTVTITKVVPSVEPTITTQPEGANYVEGASINALTVVAESTAGELSYQWQVKNGLEFEDIDGATAASYAPAISAIGSYTYRVVVTNTEESKPATSVESEDATIVIAADPSCATFVEASIPTEAPYQYTNTGEWTIYNASTSGKRNGNDQVFGNVKDFEGNTVKGFAKERCVLIFEKDMKQVRFYSANAQRAWGETPVRVSDDVESFLGTGTPSYSEYSATTSLIQADPSNNKEQIFIANGEFLAGKCYWFAFSGSLQIFQICAVEADPKAEAPVFSGALSDEAICPGNTFATLDATAAPVTSYAWYKDDEVIENAEAATYTPTEAGTYYCIATNSAAGYRSASTKSAEAVLSVNTVTAITAHVDAVGTVDAEKTISVTAEGTNLTYQWQACDVNGTVTDATVLGTAASLNVVIAAETKYYLATVTGACGVETQVVEAREWHEVEPVNVTGSRVWNWTSAAFNGIDEAIVFGNTSVEELMANVSSKVPNYESFRSDMLYGTGQYVWRPNDKYFQGFKVRFVSTVPGIVKVTYRGTGNNKNIILSINDSTYAEYQGGFTTVKNFVQAGEVVIEGVGGSGNAGGMTRIQRIEFVAEDDYHRTVNPNNIGTLCWTNNAVLVNATLYELAGKNEYNYLVFDEVEDNAIVAGKPYIFVPENGNSVIKVFNIDDAEALETPIPNESGMQGTFTELKSADGSTLYGNYVISNNHYIFVNSTNVTVGAYRAYVTSLDDVPAMNAQEAPAPGRRRIVMGGMGTNGATGFENIEASEKPVKLMIDGKIYILRGEKMYDATGRLVK